MIHKGSLLAGIALGAAGALLAKPALEAIMKGGIKVNSAFDIFSEELKEKMEDVKAEAAQKAMVEAEKRKSA